MIPIGYIKQSKRILCMQILCKYFLFPNIEKNNLVYDASTISYTC